MQLRPYQLLIKEHIMKTQRCCVFCFMGAGKTVSTLTAIVDLALVEDVFPVLIIAPLRVAKNTWPSEVRKWAHTRHLRVSSITGSSVERTRACEREADVYTINYENLVWVTEHFGERWPFKTVVADESTKLKGFRLRQGGSRAQALSKVAHIHVKRFVNLTGTPAPNGLSDLWGQLWFIDAGRRLGRTFSAYRDRWFQRSYDGFGVTPLKHAQPEIEAAIKDVCITIDAKDWFDLREPIWANIEVALPPSAQKLYDEMEKEMYFELDGHEVEAFGAAAMTQKLLQLASGAVYVGEAKSKGEREWATVHDAKLDALEDIIEESMGAPIMVAYHFKSDLGRLKKKFPKGRLLDSSKATEDEWNEGKIPLLFANPASAGHGLNLQYGGNILVYFSHDWNLENRLQMLERIGPVRQQQAGLDRAVFVYNIIAKGTADEVVLARTDGKKAVQDAFLEAMRRKYA